MSKIKTKLTIMMFVSTTLFLSVGCNNDATHNQSDTEIEEERGNDLFSVNEVIGDVTMPYPEENLSGELIVLTEEEFIEKITVLEDEKGFQYKGKTPCIVDLYADWCGPCVRLNPILIELAKEYKGKVIFYKVNTDRALNVVGAFQVNSIPTLLFFKQSAKPAIMQGAPTKEELVRAIDEMLLAENS